MANHTYIKFINSRNSRPDPTIYETHHIHPRRLGGSNSPKNLIKLSLREHFIAHMLLADIYPEMQPAFALMSNFSKYEDKRITSSRTFSRLRKEGYRRISEAMSGRIQISKNDKNKMVSKEIVDSFLLKGWSLGNVNIKGKKSVISKEGVIRRVSENEAIILLSKDWKVYSPHNGKATNENRICINNGKVNKYIIESDLINFPDWKRGSYLKSNANKIIISKDEITKYVKLEDLNYYIEKGFSFGKSKIDRSFLKRRFVTNGKVQKKLPILEAEKLVAGREFYFGVIRSSEKYATAKGTHWMNDGKINKRMSALEIENSSTQWKRGRI